MGATAKITSVIAIVLLLSGFSDPTSHSSFHVPDGDSHNILHSEGCIDTATVVVSSYLKIRKDKDTFFIESANYEVRCLKWKEYSITVSWTAPLAREDGTILNPDEIAGYELECDGVIHAIGPSVTQFTVTGLKSGLTLCRIKTLTTDGLESAWSDAVTTNLE